MSGDVVDAVPGQLELAADGGPCLLCRRPRRLWVDLCDDCADAFQDLADCLDPDQDAYLEELDVDAVLAAVRSGTMTGVSSLDLSDVLKLAVLTLEERDTIRRELGRRA